jgi:hypothetical protein
MLLTPVKRPLTEEQYSTRNKEANRVDVVGVHDRNVGFGLGHTVIRDISSVTNRMRLFCHLRSCP